MNKISQARLAAQLQRRLELEAAEKAWEAEMTERIARMTVEIRQANDELKRLFGQENSRDAMGREVRTYRLSPSPVTDYD